jgi:AcrR family transcriptional regulator
MARRRLSDTSHPDSSLVEQFWLRFGDQPQPAMRDKIIFLTSEEVATAGPTEFNTSSVCDRLGVTHPMVNHYFGSRDALLAETAFFVYARYIDSLWEAVSQAPSTPRERLRAWIVQQIEGTRELGGWGGILNYPSSSQHISDLVEQRYGPQMRELFANNIIRLGLLVRDLRDGIVTDPSTVDLQSLGEQFLAEDATVPNIVATASSIAWSTLGVSVWNAGQHLPSSKIPSLVARRDEMIQAHVERVLDSI